MRPDRTSELRKKGFPGRRLGPVQMTTDTAVRVTRIVIQQQSKSPLLYDKSSPQKSWLTNVLLETVPLNEIAYLDHPDLKINEHESTQMPFRYVKGEDGAPIMPKVSFVKHGLILRFCSGNSKLTPLPIQGMRELIAKDADKAIDDLF